MQTVYIKFLDKNDVEAVGGDSSIPPTVNFNCPECGELLFVPATLPLGVSFIFPQGELHFMGERDQGKRLASSLTTHPYIIVPRMEASYDEKQRLLDFKNVLYVDEVQFMLAVQDVCLGPKFDCKCCRKE